MEDEENKTKEQIPQEEIEAHIKNEWMKMWSQDLVEIRERFQKFKDDPELIKKLGEMIVKEVGE